MLTNLIHSVTSDSDRYGCHLWDFRLSGNILELSAKADYRKEPEEYRMSVIKIGQVLQAIDHKAALEGKSSQIQSFPSLEKSKLVALVRLHKLFNTSVTYSLTNGTTSEIEESVPVLLKSIASHYGLFFHNHTGQAIDEIMNLMNIHAENRDKNSRFYAICATTDNPFVWLKTGQWIERVRQLVEDDPSISLPLTISCIPKAQRSVLNSAFDACPYLQALIRID